jgi:hypothetical protein
MLPLLPLYNDAKPKRDLVALADAFVERLADNRPTCRHRRRLLRQQA